MHVDCLIEGILLTPVNTWTFAFQQQLEQTIAVFNFFPNLFALFVEDRRCNAFNSARVGGILQDIDTDLVGLIPVRSELRISLAPTINLRA